MNSWDLKVLYLKPRLPEILSTGDEARAIALDLAAGERLSDHEVHERAWLVVLDGEVEVATSAGDRVSGGVGLLVELAPGERHEVGVSSDARLLLLLTLLAWQRPSWRDDHPREALLAPARCQARQRLNRGFVSLGLFP